MAGQQHGDAADGVVSFEAALDGRLGDDIKADGRLVDSKSCGWFRRAAISSSSSSRPGTARGRLLGQAPHLEHLSFAPSSLRAMIAIVRGAAGLIPPELRLLLKPALTRLIRESVAR